MLQEGEVARIWCTPAKCQNKFGGYRHFAEKHLFSSMKEYIDFMLDDWLYQPHIKELIEHKTFLEDGPIVLKRIDDEDYMQIPLFRQIAYLCETIRTAKTLKLTAIGNLPRAVVHEIYKLGIRDQYFEKNMARLRKETDWYTVPLTRILTEMGGLVKKRGNALTLTKKGERVLKNRHLLLKNILVTFGYKLSWANFDLFEDLVLGQRGFGLSLLLMADYGNQPRDSRFYSERYFYHNSRGSRKKYAQHFYTTRTLDRFMRNLGLISFDERNRYTEEEQVTVAKTPLFDKLLAVDRNFGKITYKAEAAVPLYRLHMSLKGAQPAIWREFIVPGDISLVQLHVVIQTVMGWTNSHLHLFVKEGVEYSFRYQSDDFWEEWGYTDYKGMKASDLILKIGDTLEYLYDFGDSWYHIIELEEVINDSSIDIPFLICIDGARRCPTEDSGGISGYHENMDIIKDPTHEEYENTLTWLGDGFDPEYFSLQEVNKVLAGYCLARHL